MDFVSVESGTVDQVGYDTCLSELQIIFKSGGRHYVYSDVPPSVYQDFLDAPSKGRFVHVVLKNGPYPCRRLG